MADNSYDRYPLVSKALAEQRAIFKNHSDGMPAELHAATQRALALLDTCLDAALLPKEDIMAVAVLMNCPPYLALKSQRFAADYNPHVQRMIDIHTQRIGVTAANEDLIQVYSALFVAHGENLLQQIRTIGAADPHWLRDIRENLEDYADDRAAFAHKIAPALAAVETALIAQTLQTIEAALPKPAPKVKKPRPPGL